MGERSGPTTPTARDLLLAGVGAAWNGDGKGGGDGGADREGRDSPPEWRLGSGSGEASERTEDTHGASWAEPERQEEVPERARSHFCIP